MKVILITGASSGIGYDAAAALLRLGHKVYGAARRVEKIPDGVVPIKMDITSSEDVSSAVKTVLDAEGRLDVLINNAGYGYFGAIENVTLEDARRQMEVNLFGLAALTREVIPVMRKQGCGRIINVASVAGKANLYFGGWYHVSKFAVEAFSDALRIELKPFGIDVSIIEPGAIKTDWGPIAADHLEESSRGTAYEEPALREAATLRFAYGLNILSKPSVVTRAIVRAVESRRPKARYRMGFGSRTIVWTHALLPDKWWDAIVRLGGKLKIGKP